jgi:quercetin dioxygenase-like cupin family protein
MIVVVKMWGLEEVVETNPKYTLKRITMHSGKRCSLQYHEVKTETIYNISGTLLVTIEGVEHTLSPGDYCTILPGEIHRMSAVEGNCVYIEASTSELGDVVRLETDYPGADVDYANS